MESLEDVVAENRRRALAVEGALVMLIDGLACRGTIAADEAEDMLRVLSKSSDFSAARASNSLRLVQQLRRLRQGDGNMTPGV
jgi:hypothetical protein